MAKYQKKPMIVEANQYKKRGECPLGVCTNEDGTAYVTTIQGVKTPIGIGEWSIQEADGIHYYPCADSVFRRTYDPV